MRVLALSGSLRARSSNRELLLALARLAPPGVEVVGWDGLASIPPFNPDDDGEGAIPPAPVAALREAVQGAAAVVISSPEYAHGVPGSLKNALDWLVSSPAMIDKPVALVAASTRATYVNVQLAETLRTMSARLVEGASIAVNVSGRPLDAAAIAADEALAAPLRAALAALVAAG